MMSSRNLLNLVLLLAVTALALFVMLNPEEQNESKFSKLTTLRVEDVHKIKLLRQSGDEILLHREKGIWYMDKPYAHPANDFRIQSLLRLLQTESFSSHALSGLDSRKFDLDSPRARVIFNDKLEIAFGGTEPLQQHRYVKIANTMHLIVDTFFYQVSGQPSAFMSHALLPPGKIQRLKLPDLEIAFVENKWKLSPEREDLSADSVVEMLNNWRNVQAIRLAPYQGRNLKPDIRIEYQDAQPAVEFSIHKTDDEFSVIRVDNKLQYFLSDDKAETLLKLPESDSANDDDPLTDAQPDKAEQK